MSKEKKQNWYKNPRKYHFIYKTTCSVNGKYYYEIRQRELQVRNLGVLLRSREFETERSGVDHRGDVE